MIGTVLGGYQVIEKIKDGSVGTVYKGRNPSNQDVAIKVISEKSLRKPHAKRMFRREADIATRLNHPAIIKIRKYADGPPRPYIIMEFFLSEDLKYAFWHRPAWVRGQEFYLLPQIAEARHYCHQQGIVHRDVKPENVLVNARSQIRLIDFSIAQTGSFWERLFGRKGAQGTPLYMAPEQIQGAPADPRSDMYSFGVMAFELLARKPPFIGVNEKSILERHLKAPPPSLRSIVPRASREMDEFLQRLLAKKPADRFADMSTVYFELSKWEKKGTEIRLREVGPIEPKSK